METVSAYNLVAASYRAIGYATLESILELSDRGAVSEVTTALNFEAVSTYIFVVASWFATGSPTLESTLVASERGAVSFVTAELNLEEVLIVLSTYNLVAAS